MPESNDRLYRKTKNGKPSGPWYGWLYSGPAGRPKYVCLRTLDRRAATTLLRRLEREAARATDRPADAGAAIDARRRDGAQPIARSTTAYTLMQAFADFLDFGCRGKSKATGAMYLQKARHVLRVLGESLALDELTLEDVDGYIRTRETEGAHGGTIYKETVTLRQALKWAVSRKRFAGDPNAVVPALKNEYEPRTRHLSVDEFGKLVQQLNPQHLLWTLVAAYTGARRSDVERVLWEQHVDLDGRWIRLPGRKTKRSNRVVPIPDGLHEFLSRTPVAERRGPLVREWKNPVRDLAAACARAGIPKVTPNDLRRSYASWMKQGGEDSMVVARLLGHSSTTMVETVYGQLGNQNFRDAADKLPALPGSTSVVTTDARQASQSRRHTSSAKPRTRRRTAKTGSDAVPTSAVPRGGIEPPTRGFSVRCSTN
jgi:integrase